MPEDLKICVDDVYIKLQTSISLLGITLKSHISSIYKSASCQLNALFRLKNFLGFNERKISNRNYTAQKMKVFMKDFFSKCDQICNLLQIWSHLLKKSSIKNFFFCAVLLQCLCSQKVLHQKV